MKATLDSENFRGDAQMDSKLKIKLFKKIGFFKERQKP